MKIITVLQQKGGVGKTTLALNLALYFQQEGVDVAVVDADNQGSLREAYDMLDNPAIGLIDVPALLTDETLPGRFDLLIVDTSPRNDVYLANILQRTDFALLPVRPGFLDLMAMKDTEALLYQSDYKGPAGIVLNQVRHRNSMNRDIAEMLQRFDIPVLETQIFQRVAYERSTMTNGVFGSDDAKAKDEITRLGDEIYSKL